MTFDEALGFALDLPESTLRESRDGLVSLRVRDRAFAYCNEGEGVLTLKALREEQEALVASDPEAFGESWGSGRYAWVRVRLRCAFADEVRELITEAWRHSAPRRLAASLDR
ncbi:hypothetical protein Val02_58780 [Virgisporangium aliadipatigenens]|uniref:MmcQ/YjbR family DNA-binding protein n=1 Tax=Virgisporangium aliadipatigenens TaxID=741659 RepID=A0A8J3YQZ2_9ACTN|nr:MmcQ/YjbR family DNA-binding protein [Virgisporangium aliadipatigenens]GIJ48992.1 hypothetical protein Val02_58780 [Virgisporangium aliadipatigenens]